MVVIFSFIDIDRAQARQSLKNSHCAKEAQVSSLRGIGYWSIRVMGFSDK